MQDPAISQGSCQAEFLLGYSSLHELIPTAVVIALLVNPANPSLAETTTKEMQAAARTLVLELHILNASNERDFDAVFEKLAKLRANLRVCR